MLILHDNGSDRFLFINAVKMYQFKAKDSEIKPYSLFLVNIEKTFRVDNMKKSIHVFLLIIMLLMLAIF